MGGRNGQNFIKPLDILVIFLTLLTIVILMVQPLSDSSEKVIATVTVNGKNVKKFILSDAEDEILRLEEAPEVTLEIKDKKIRFINSQCPDGTCEKSGFLEKAGDTAACLPAKTVVSISGSSDGIDAVAG